MAIIACDVSDEIERWLNQAAAEQGLTVQDLAAAAIEEAALRYRICSLRRIQSLLANGE